ncbi:glycosyltransferase family 2 protein [Clostridium perfringens]|uniref:glycosyltransferase family 2 protein n=1 Tax=Clostridium perfringens TaxID=1502 RepID=UPI001ABA4F5D|nr:glycosyltransferase family 2 protein [Clostridium perfringens]MBO3335132.1 glycosyltransferase family 2 protein [Clostridium perfringens]
MSIIKFSVLIPVYNVEIFLRECIDSVLNQTYKNFEIIIVNDGSTDSSLDICNEYARKDKRIKVYSQVNQGLITARRKAISEASGDYYLFLDSDDFWELNLLETINRVIIEEKCDLVIYKYRRVSESGEFLSEVKSSFENKTTFSIDNKEKLFREVSSGSNLNNLVCKAVKNSIVDNIDYRKYKNIKNAEDLLQSLPLMYNAEKIIYLDNVLYNYRIAKNSITQKFNINSFNDFTVARKLLLEYMKKLNICTKENLGIFYNFYLECTLDYIFELINSDKSLELKHSKMLEIKNEEVFQNSLNYYIKISFKHKVILYLFNNNNYNLLNKFIKCTNFLKKLK